MNNEQSAYYWIAKKDFDKCAASGSLAVEPLIAILWSLDNDICPMVATTLRTIGDPRVIEPLKEYENYLWRSQSSSGGGAIIG